MRVQIIDYKELFIECPKQDVQHLISIFIRSMVLYREDYGIMIGMVVAKFIDGFYGFFKIYRLAQGFIIDGMCDDGLASIVVHIQLHALQASFQILNVSLYLRVTCKLVSRKIGVVRRVTIVRGQRVVLICLLGNHCIIGLLAHQKTAEIIETYHVLCLVQDLFDNIGFLPLVHGQKLMKGLFSQQRSQVIIVIVKLVISVFFENRLHLLAAVDYLKVVSNFIMADLGIISQLLIVDP